MTEYQKKIEEWKKIEEKDRYFSTKVWEIVEAYYDKDVDCTTIMYTQQIRQGYITTEIIVDRKWSEEGDARPRLEEAGYIGSIIVSSSGRKQKWIRESFDYLPNYQ